jgi:hypothetical protein
MTCHCELCGEDDRENWITDAELKVVLSKVEERE